MLKTFEIKLDLEKELYGRTDFLFGVSKSDMDSVELQFEILQDEAAVDLTGTIVQLAIKKPSGLVFYQDCFIENAVEGKASAKLSAAANLEHGIHISEVYIKTEGQVAVTCPFYFTSREAMIQTEIIGGGGGITSWDDILGKPSEFPPSAHLHTIADVSNLQAELDAKANDTDLAGLAPADHSHTFDSITGKPATYPPDLHNHAIADVTGLQLALDGKADDAELAAKANAADVYTKAQTYNKTEIDQMTMGDAGGSPVIVEDNLASTNPTNALSANQGRILEETKAETIHTHEIADVNGLQAELDTHLKELPNHTHTVTFAELTEKPTTLLGYGITDAASDQDLMDQAIYQNGEIARLDAAIGTKLDAIPAEYLTEAEGDTKYMPVGSPPTAHTHPWGEITGKPTTFTPPIMSGAAVGGARVGNGLSMSGEYLYLKAGAGVGIAGDNSVQVQDVTGVPVKFWRGSQAAYDGIVTKDANTLYFITG